jgi:hypothetical protein
LFDLKIAQLLELGYRFFPAALERRGKDEIRMHLAAAERCGEPSPSKLAR